MSLKRILLFCSFFALSLSGCEDDKETAPSNVKTQQLTASPWRITTWTRTTDGGPAASQLPAAACERDDRYVFGTNGVLTRNEGLQACAGGSPQGIVSTSPWNFNSAQTVLTIGSAGMGATSIPYDVVQLTADVM